LSTLQQYIKEKYNDPYWFVEFVNEIHNQQRVQDVVAKKEYLNGSHAILKRQSYKYNGKEFHPRKIVLQYAKTLLNFQKAYLLQYPVTLTGDKKVIEEFSKVNKKAKFDRTNIKLLDKVLKYGMCAEYLYIDNGVIKSKILDPSEFYPLYDHEQNLIAVVEAYIVDGISYYTVFTDKTVEKYSDAGG